MSCGQSKTQQVEIVDPKTGSPCDSGAVGEVWISGESVAAGYWNQVTATKETFNNTVEKKGENFLRTGDLGFIHSGELFITGRLKDLIVIRGQNYYPQDIELSVGQAHVSLQSAAAFSLDAEVDQAESERLVIVQELSRTAVRQIRKQTLQVAEIFEAIRAGVSGQHGLQIGAIALLKPGHLPKTTSGKVQRQSCKQQFLAGTLETVAQWKQVSCKSQNIPVSEEVAVREPIKKTDEKAEALLEWLRDYAKTSINSRVMDERRCLSPNIVLDFGNKGLLGMQVPQQYGGLGLNNSSTLQIIEQLGAIDTTLALFVGLNNVLGIRPILHYAQPALKAELLPRLATGRELAAFALTESGAGSHPLGMAAKATPTAIGCWQLTGEKIWSGSAAWAGVTNVFVQQVDAAGMPIGISGFAVKKGTPGLKQGPEALTMGMRGMVQNTVLLEGALVSDAERLGEAGKGMAVAQDAMMYGRLAIAAACVGGLKRCAQLMLRYSGRRTVSTGRLLDNPVTMTRLNWLVNAIAATESLVTLTATRLDENLPVPEEVYAACKIVAPEFYWQAADNLVQCLGGRGYIETNLAPQILRDARVLRIFEGPTESLAMYLGSRVVNQPETLKDFFEALHISTTSSLLFESAGSITSHYLSEKSAFPDRLTALRQAHFVIGKTAAWAILLASLEATAAPMSAVIWCQKTLEQAVKQAMEIQPDESANGNSTVESIERYQQSIGEIEQTLAGTDEFTDDLLKLDKQLLTTLPNELSAKQNNSLSSVPQVRTKSHGQAHGQARKRSSSASAAGKRTKAIESWLVQWLSEQLKVEVDKIDVNKAFADYGLDSVMAVELAQDLGTFFKLSEPLEVTLAWNFPTIQSLANHLAIMLAQQEMMLSNSSGADEKVPTENSNTLNNFSEAEAADALAAELMAMRGQ
ncbi:MAG: acyl-CoA dehydrogenase family protein [Cyanobacteria bacterium P01_C01_bin.121]